MQQGVLGGQSILKHAAAPNTTNTLENLPKTHIAKFIPHEKYPTTCTKQSRYKQSLPWHSLIHYYIVVEYIGMTTTFTKWIYFILAVFSLPIILNYILFYCFPIWFLCSPLLLNLSYHLVSLINKIFSIISKKNYYVNIYILIPNHFHSFYSSTLTMFRIICNLAI